MTRGPALLALSFVLLFAGCEAGPSVFNRAQPGVADTADVAELPDLPQAMDVETTADSLDVEVADDGSVLDSLGSTLPPPPPTVASRDRSAVTAHGFQRPEHVRGLYLNAWASGSRGRVGALLDIARRTEVNTFVIDIKDATGYVSHRTAVPTSHEIGATEEVRIRDLPGLLERLKGEGIYPVARIVLVKDPLLAAAYPDMAIQDTAGGVFVDGKGIVWLNPYDQRVWHYHVELAREVAELGFPEIQWDYVRFPDIPASQRARTVYPGSGGISPAEAIGDFLRYSRAQLSDLDVQVTADVFGITTSASRDVGIGQVWESLIDAVDVALPMVYPSHYWSGSFGFEKPNAYPYEVVKRATEDALRRSARVDGAGLTRPWLQAFTLGAPRYEVPEVRAQIQATYDAGVQEWILWNPGSRYAEGALEPVGGFTEEPLIRVAGEIIEVSRRHAVLDSLEALRNPPEPESPAVEDSVGAPAPDTFPPVSDTIPSAADTLSAPPDTSTARPDTVVAIPDTLAVAPGTFSVRR